MIYREHIRNMMGNAMQIKEVQGIPPLSLPKSKGKALKDYKVYGNSYQRLPQEYQEVEYIETTNTQFIETNLLNSEWHKIKVEFSASSAEEATIIGGNGTQFLYVTNYEVTSYPIAPSKLSVEQHQIIDATITSLSSTRIQVELPGLTYQSNKQSGTDAKNCYILSMRNTGGSRYIGKARFYYCKIYDNNDTLIRDFIPCYNKTTNVIGLYDLVEDKFYTNAGKGTFLKGADVKPSPDEPIEIESVGDLIIPSKYQEVEYIESTGTQYIDLPYGFYKTDKIEIQGSISSSAGDKFMVAPSTWNDNKNRFAMLGQTGGNFSFGYGGDSTSNTTFGVARDNKIHNYKYDNLIFTLDNLTTFDVSGIEFGGETKYLKLFYGYNALTQGKIYYFKQTKANGNELNLIPCYRKSDNEIGMYDIVSGVFYTNQGTGTFNKGNDVNHYKIPIEVKNGTNTFTTNIYLNEPLRRIGEYTDYIDFKNQKVVRNVGAKNLKGTEDWRYFSSYNCYYLQILDMKVLSSYPYGLCNRFKVGQRTLQGCIQFGGGNNYIYIHDDNEYADATLFKNWLLLNNAEIVYPLATTTEESITLPPILTAKGDNTLDINTKILPSNVEIKYIK